MRLKKTIKLLVLMSMVFPITAEAITDNQYYEPVNGINIANMWIFDRVHTPSSYTTNPICNQRARMATMIDGVIYVGRSEEILCYVGGEQSYQSVIHRFSVDNGSPLPDLPLTLDGEPYCRFLGVVSVGRDNFGHLWVAPMTNNVQVTIPVYMVDVETGEMTLIVEMEKGDAPQRTDYLDVMGDLTLEQAECNVMTVAGSTTDPGYPTVYRMHADQGGDWEGGFHGDPYLDIIEFYPDWKTGFSLMPVIKMVQQSEDDYSGGLFYIDCFDSAPVLYSIDGTIIDTFEGVNPELIPMNAPNGCAEFKLDGRDFFVYAKSDMHGNGHGCQANICELGDDQTLAGMQKYWQIPADSLGKVNDSGQRIHCFTIDKDVDENGNEVVTLFTFKAYNGMGIYKISKKANISNTIMIGKICYRYDSATHTAEVISVDRNDLLTDVVIPATIVVDDEQYTVTEVANGAFSGCNLRSVSIYANITEGTNGFNGCTVGTLYVADNVTTMLGLGINPSVIYCFGLTPPVCDDNTFSGYNAALHVPIQATADYFMADVWCNFNNINSDAGEQPKSLLLNQENATIDLGKTLQLSATANPNNVVPILWQSTNTEVATVTANGLVTALATGEADIVVTCMGLSKQCHVIVQEAAIVATINQHELTLDRGSEAILTATSSPIITNINWHSTNTDVVSVTVENGQALVHAIAPGEALVIATPEGDNVIPDTCRVTVNEITIVVSIDKHQLRMKRSDTAYLTATTLPFEADVTWRSTDTNVALVREVNGRALVLANRPGEAFIIANAEGEQVQPDTCRVTVKRPKGDANNDGLVDVTDVNEVVNIILGKVEDFEINPFVDTNDDNKIDVTDVNNIVNVILGKIIDESVNDSFEFLDKYGNTISNETSLFLTEVTSEEDIFTGDIMNIIYSHVKVHNTKATEQALRINLTIERIDNGFYQICFPMACKTYHQNGNYITEGGLLSAHETRDLMTEWISETAGECNVTMKIEVLDVSGSILNPTYTYLEDGPTIRLEFRNARN